METRRRPSGTGEAQQQQGPSQPAQRRTRRLSVDQDNILGADSGQQTVRSKRRRSPSPHPQQPSSSTQAATAQDATQVAEKRDLAKTKGTEMYDTVMSKQDADGRFLASEFIRLPNKRQFADYYATIKHPVSLETIHARLELTGASSSAAAEVPASASASGTGNKLRIKLNTSKGTVSTMAEVPPPAKNQATTEEGYRGYKDLDHVKRDFDTMWGNAKRYNQKDSGIFKDAQRLHKLTKAMYNDCFAANDRQASATPEPAPDTAGEGPESSAAQSEKTRPTTGRSRKKQRGPEQTDPKSSAGDDKMDTEPVSVSLLIKQGIKQLESATTGSPARQVAAFFTSLPSKRDYPDYYMFIKSPISLKEIRNKSEKEKYPNLEEWSQDVKLMCENAKFYNEPGSMVYENAEVMERILSEILSDAYKRLGTSPPSNTLPKLKLSLKQAAPVDQTPSKASASDEPIAKPVQDRKSTTPAVLPPTSQAKAPAPAPHHEKPRNVSSGSVPRASPAAPSPHMSQPGLATHPAPAPRPYAVPPVPTPNIPMGTRGVPPRNSHSPFNAPHLANQSPSASPSPRLGGSNPGHPSMSFVGGPGQHAQPAPSPAHSPGWPRTPGAPLGSGPSMHPMPAPPTGAPHAFGMTPGRPLPSGPGMHAGPPMMPLHDTTRSPVPPPSNAGPIAPPKPSTTVIPPTRRPIPKVPLLKSLEVAFDVTPSASSLVSHPDSRMRKVKLQNQRGLTSHITLVRPETTRLEIVATLQRGIKTADSTKNEPRAETPKAPEDDPMNGGSGHVELMPRTEPKPEPEPEFTLWYEGRRIAGTRCLSSTETSTDGHQLAARDNGSVLSGYKWDVPILLTGVGGGNKGKGQGPAISTVQVKVDGEVYHIFVTRQL